MAGQILIYFSTVTAGFQSGTPDGEKIENYLIIPGKSLKIIVLMSFWRNYGI